MLKNPQPFVSIALCTYNGSKFLPEQIESVLNQEYTNFELVIVDDDSKDNTCDIISSYLNDSRIRFYKNEKNLGYAANFGKALSLCSGELIALSDQDDIWLPKKIKFMVSLIGATSGLYHNSVFMTETGKLTDVKLTDKVHFVSGKNPESLLLYNYVGGHTLMIKREVLKYALPIPKGIYHDWWIAFVCMNLDGLDYIEKPLVYYRLHDSNQTVLAERNRKIYKTDIHKLKRYKKVRKVSESIHLLEIFEKANFVSAGLRFKIKRLIRLEKDRLKSAFSFRLFSFLVNNISIYDSSHRGYLGKLNAIRKDSQG